MRKIIFIVGVGRSGTTLLQNMLNSHPEIAFIPEINYMRRFLFNKRLLKRFRRNKDSFIKDLENDKWIRRLDENILNDINIEKIEETDFASELYKAILDANCRINNKSFAGDKDPRSIELVGKINKRIEGIYWIHIIRDPRDVLLSKRNAGWSKKSNTLKHLFAGCAQLKLATKWSAKFPDNFYELYYEDLLPNPEKELAQLCKKLTLKYNQDMLSFTDSAEQLIAKDELEWKKEVFSPLIKENQSKWKEHLDVKSIALTESLVAPAFKSYNYKKTNPKISYLFKIRLSLLKPVFYIFTTLYVWYKRI